MGDCSDAMMPMQRRTRSWMLVLLIACAQAPLSESATQPSNGATAAAFVPRDTGVAGGADSTGDLQTSSDDTVGDSETKTRIRKVKRKVKRRRKAILQQSATSDSILNRVPEVPTKGRAQREANAIPTHESELSTPSLADLVRTPKETGKISKQDSESSVQSEESNLAFIGDLSKYVSASSQAKTAKPESLKKEVNKHHARTQSSGKTEIGADKKRSVSGGKEGECLRRIKREWKDAVALGIAYDWGKMETITRKNKKGRVTTDPKYNYVRMGPMGKNLLRWHFSVQGAPNSVYEEGIYHGRVLLPKDYPASPPRVQMLTPSGRFVTGEDICLSASSYHPESWTPRWTVLSLIDALRLHMLTSANEIGGTHASNDARREHAIKSRSWRRGVVDHAQMVASGIFSLESDSDGSDGAVSNKQQITPSRTNAPSDEEILGLVTADAIRRHTERTAQAAQSRSSAPKLFLVIRVLFRSAISILTNPFKLALVIFMVIFAHLNR
mmetsp:Transcript_17997/g.39005  ORF Transcript_17997/g.39005 Transcript_17997/m.39005 type:complete len:499 (+) Transcript_17997:157-1653(+)